MATAPVAGMGIQVEGLRELARGLKGGEERLDKQLRGRLKELSQDIANDAKAMAAGLQPKVPSWVIRSIVGRAQSASAEIKLCTNSRPGSLGWEFGAAQNFPRNTSRGRVLGWNQFPEWRGNDENAGYFLWPTIRKHRATLMDDLVQILEDIMSEGEAAA